MVRPKCPCTASFPRSSPRVTMKRILFVFLDGVGLGPSGPQNPFSTTAVPHLAELAGHASWTNELSRIQRPLHLVQAIDATLGVDGLPQSGTGQATLFTGVNCASLVGRHFGPFPHSSTHEILQQKSLFRRLQEISSPETSRDGRSAETQEEIVASAFANAYPPQFFDFVRNRGRLTVTTRACMEASVTVRGIDALRSGRAIPADLTGDAWRDKLDLDVSRIPATESGRRLLELSRSYRCTLFEYFLTDKMGHGRLEEKPGALLRQIDRFLGAILDDLQPATEALVVTSDHGNLEDLGSKTHTRNPVPLFVHGWAAPYFESVTSLTGVTPAVVRALQSDTRENGEPPAPSGTRE